MKAVWNDTVIAESDDTIVVENNHYFPPDAVRSDLLEPSSTHSTCPWKGEASYSSIVADGARNEDAVWTYPEPKEAAESIRDHVAFWKGVDVTD